MTNSSTILVSNHRPYSFYFSLFAGLLMNIGVSSGQSFLGLDGGFEGSATIDNTNTYSAGQSGKWTKANATQTINIETTIVRSGGKSLSINNTSTTTGRRCYTPTFSPASGQRLVIQYYRLVNNLTNTQGSHCVISRDGTISSEAAQSSTYSMPTGSNVWEKVEFSPSSTDYVTTVFASILHKQVGTGGNLFIDDLCVYNASSADNTSPDAPTAAVINSDNLNSLTVSWTAPVPGTDSGGYLVVRGTTDPSTAPKVNGIYAVGNNIGTGVVVYQGTNTSFTDVGLTPISAYYYRIYTYDKAYNYSASLNANGITPEVSTPVATAASSIASTGFTANWGTASGATGYRIDVANTSNFGYSFIVSENFSGFTTNNGSSDRSSTLDTYLQNSGWTGDGIYEMTGYAKLGTASKLGYIVSPSLNLAGNSGNTTLKFDVFKYGTDATNIQLFHAADGTNFIQVGSDISAPSEFTTQTINISGTTAYSKIKIAAKNATNNRFYLDNIVLTQENPAAIIAGYNDLYVSTTSQPVTNLLPNTTYYYRVRSVGASSTSPSSNVIAVTTSNTIPISSGTTNASALPDCPACNIAVAGGATLTIDETRTFNSVTVAPNGRVSLAAGRALNSPITLQSNASGTATFVNENTSAQTITGTVQNYLAHMRNWYVSSPVSNAVAPAGYIYYQRDEAGVSWTSKPFVQDSIFVRGHGYLALPSSAASTLTFSGTLNHGDIPIYLTATGASSTGFNLIGNPYPAHLTWTKAFVDANTALIEPTIYYRTTSGTQNNAVGWSFKSINASSGEVSPVGTTAVIPPMQAFWIKAKQTGTLTLNSSLTRSHETGNPLKAPSEAKTERKRLRLQVTNDNLGTDETLIYFDAQASDGYDSFDSPRFEEADSKMQLYSLIDSKKLVINGRSGFVNNTELPLGFTAGASGNFSISATQLNNFETGVQILLIDKQTNSSSDLSTGSYTFSTDATTDTDRFSILFKVADATSGTSDTAFDKANIFVNAQNQLVIQSSAGNIYRVYDALGQLIERGILKSDFNILNSNITSGLYFVKVGIGTKRVLLK